MKPMSLAAAFRRISGLTGLSRILGFLRDIAFAAFLGAGPAADAFLVALKLPNMFRRLTAEGALANAFVPSFAEVRDADGSGPAMRLAGETCWAASAPPERHLPPAPRRGKPRRQYRAEIPECG